MTTKYPFEIPACLIASIPSPDRDGNAYVDVRFRGRWDGILVINADHRCVGVYVGRDIVEWPLSFTSDEIEDMRPASFWNRMLASLPAGLDPYGIAIATVWIVCPVLFVLGLATNIWMLPLLVPVVMICMDVMYSVSGFPFTRFPTALVALCILAASVIGFAVKWFA